MISVVQATIEHARFLTGALENRHADGAPRAELAELASELVEAAEALKEATQANGASQ